MKEELVSLGLSDREAEAYLALLRNPSSSVTDLARRVKEHRSNIYDTLQSLTKKGLVSHAVKGGARRFRATEPERILEMLKEKEEIAKEVVERLKAQAPSKETPSITVYEGEAGFRSILSLVLRTKATIYGIAASEEWMHRFPLPTQRYMRQREKRGIHAKLLYVQGSEPIRHPLNEIRFLPTAFAQPASIAIFGEYVAVFMWTDPLLASVTHSANLSGSFRRYFDILWKAAES